jgi:hypothetical protein
MYQMHGTQWQPKPLKVGQEECNGKQVDGLSNVGLPHVTGLLVEAA